MTERRKRRWAFILLVVAIAALLVAADIVAESVAERELADRVEAAVPEAEATSAEIRAFPFLPRLLTSGRVSEVDAHAEGLTVRGLRFESISVELHGVRLDRSDLLGGGQLAVEEIERGRVRADVTQEALSEVLGVPIGLEPGGVSLTVAGREIEAEVAVRDGRLELAAAGLSLPVLDLLAPLLPCVAGAEIAAGRLVLTCEFTEVPEELRASLEA